MAQATHGSAPDIAGKGIANPFAMIEIDPHDVRLARAITAASARSLEMAADADRGIEKALANPATRTKDIKERAARPT